MNYEERYNQTIESIKRIYDQADSYGRELMEKEFPELRESEDEQHRKWILEYLYNGLRKSDEQFKDQYKSAIAWLEKQGEEKSDQRYDIIEELIKADDIYQMSMNDAMVEEAKSKAIASISKLSISELLELEKQGEKSWSEEDEKMLSSIIEEVYPYGECPDYPTEEEREYYYTHHNMVDWLKSLKPNHWKPSEEQMEALKYFISFHEDHARSLTTKWEEFKNLESLYNDLKSL